MALNQWIYGDNISFEYILKLVLNILKYENVFEVGLVQPLQLGRTLDKTTKLASTFCVNTFLLEVLNTNFFVGGFEYILFLLEVLNRSGKAGLVLVAIDIPFYDLRNLT